MPGEGVHSVIVAADSSALVATDRRLLILRHGRLLSGWAVGRNSMVIDYANLSGIEFERGILHAMVVIRGPGLPVGPVDHKRDWNAIRVYASNKADQKAVEEIRRHISLAHNPHRVVPTMESPPQSRDVVVQRLDQLKALLDEELITDEEYTEAILVFSYPGRTQADAATLFARHSQNLSAQGYRPISQSWGEGRPGAGRVLMLGEIAESIRPNGFLTITYERERPTAAAGGPVGLVDRLTQLGEAHRLGLITEEEFAAQRQKAIETL